MESPSTDNPLPETVDPKSADFIQSSNLVEKKIGHNKLQLENEQLLSQLADKTKQIDDLQCQLTNATQKCASIEALNRQLTEEKTRLTDQVQSAQNSLQNSVSIELYNESKDQISKLSSTHASQTEELNSLLNLYNNSLKLYEEASALATELQFSNTNLQQNFDQLSAEYAVSIEQNNSLKNEINTLQNNVESHVAEINSLKAQISQSKQVALELNAIIEEKGKEIETLNSASVLAVPEYTNKVITGKSVRTPRYRR